jgi:hypothetical protein
MNLFNTFKNAQRDARKKLFSVKDQIELCYLEKQISDYGFRPSSWCFLYIDEAVQKYSTIIEMKGEYKHRFKHQEVKDAAQ